LMPDPIQLLNFFNSRLRRGGQRRCIASGQRYKVIEPAKRAPGFPRSPFLAWDLFNFES
jgi:hypothetical protein